MKSKNKEHLKLISEFFRIIEKLQENKIIRSSKYLGDIGEFLVAQNVENVTLVDNQRNESVDGQLIRGSKKFDIQIKLHNGEAGNNIDVGNPKNYDILFLVIGPNSKLRLDNNDSESFHIYEFTKDEVQKWKKKSGKYSCGTKSIRNFKNEIVVRYDFSKDSNKIAS